MIHNGGNSGYQAINLAYLWGARRLVLLGFDCKKDKAGKRHWFGEHPSPLTLTQESTYADWRRNFTALAADLKKEGVEVINCSPDSALACWPRLPISQVLCALPA